jgi:hypothetical protein
MISQLAIQKILGINEKVFVDPKDMVTQMVVSFYPQKNNVSENIKNAQILLKDKLLSLGVKEIPYSDIFIRISNYKRYKRRFKFYINNLSFAYNKILLRKTNDIFFIDKKTIKNLTAKFKYRSGVCVIVPGVLDTYDLPMQYIKSFKDNSIISILDFPKMTDENSSFEHHFDTSMQMFAHNMSNIVLAVDDLRWMIYNFNSSHPIFNFKDTDKLDYFILNGLIPKVVAPITPHRIEEFSILKEKYNSENEKYRSALDDLKKGSFLYGKTNLFPKGKKIDDLNFRNNLHKQIGKIHLDSRNGMSFGFTAKQIPTEVIKARFIDLDNRKNNYKDDVDFKIDEKGGIYVICEIKNKIIEIKIPEVWILSLRSCSDKTNFDTE